MTAAPSPPSISAPQPPRSSIPSCAAPRLITRGCAMPQASPPPARSPLFMNRGDRAGGGLACGIAQPRVISLGAAQDGIDERGGCGAEIEGGDGAAVIGLQKRLSFERGKQQLVGAVGVVVQEFDARDECAGNLPVSDGLGANQIAPGIGAEMRGIDSAKNAVPIGVVALGAQEQIARLQQFIGGL